MDKRVALPGVNSNNDSLESLIKMLCTENNTSLEIEQSEKFYSGEHANDVIPDVAVQSMIQVLEKSRLASPTKIENGIRVYGAEDVIKVPVSSIAHLNVVEDENSSEDGELEFDVEKDFSFDDDSAHKLDDLVSISDDSAFVSNDDSASVLNDSASVSDDSVYVSNVSEIKNASSKATKPPPERVLRAVNETIFYSSPALIENESTCNNGKSKKSKSVRIFGKRLQRYFRKKKENPETRRKSIIEEQEFSLNTWKESVIVPEHEHQAITGIDMHHGGCKVNSTKNDLSPMDSFSSFALSRSTSEIQQPFPEVDCNARSYDAVDPKDPVSKSLFSRNVQISLNLRHPLSDLQLDRQGFLLTSPEPVESFYSSATLNTPSPNKHRRQYNSTPDTVSISDEDSVVFSLSNTSLECIETQKIDNAADID